MTRTRTALKLLISITLAFQFACSSGEPEPAAAGKARAETPHEAVRSIVALYAERDFDSLVRTRYAEIAKAKDDAQVQALIDKLAAKFKDEAVLKEAISIYSSALEVDPVLSEDGSEATFNLDETAFKLSKMSGGKWGFRL